MGGRGPSANVCKGWKTDLTFGVARLVVELVYSGCSQGQQGWKAENALVFLSLRAMKTCPDRLGGK